MKEPVATERERELTRKIDALVTVVKMLSEDMGLDDLLHLIVAKTSEAMNAERSTIFLIDEDKGQLWSKVAQETENQEIRLKMGQGLAGHVWQTGQAVNVTNAYDDPRFDPQFDRLTGWKTGSLIAVPMRNYGGKMLGVLQVMNHKSGRFSQHDEEVLTALASAGALALEGARLRQQATRDFLTGLRNRHGFQELYEKELAKAKRHARMLAAVMLDIDNFKEINDNFGHTVGDEVLRNVGVMMRKHFRAGDILARFGGDEFVAILPETDERGAAIWVRRLREAIASFNSQGILPVPISISVGTAAADRNQDRLLERADRAMYEDKRRRGWTPTPNHS